MIERNISLDILKLIMACMVVALHAEFLDDVSELGRYLSVNGVLRMAVPIFLLINGFYFYPILVANKQRVWLKKICVLYLFWMAAYSWYWFYIPAFSAYGITQFIFRFIVGFWHLWYLSGLIGAALVFIALQKISSAYLLLLAVLAFLIGVLVQYGGHYHWIENQSIDHALNLPWVHRNFLMFSFPFFCAGFLINKHAVHQKITANAALVLVVLGVGLLLAESYANFQHPNTDRYFDNLAALMVACPACFLFFIKQTIIGCSKQVALYSSAIYYIQGFVLILLSRYMPVGTWLALVGLVLSVMAAAAVIVIHRRLKFIL